MSDDDELTRKAKAERLRKRIRQFILGEGENQEAPNEKEAPYQESPREFVERRMKELEKKGGNDKDSSGRKHTRSKRRKSSR